MDMPDDDDQPEESKANETILEHLDEGEDESPKQDEARRASIGKLLFKLVMLPDGQ